MEMPPITHHSRGDLLPLGAWQTPKNSGLVLIKTLLQLVEQMPSADSIYKFSDFDWKI